MKAKLLAILTAVKNDLLDTWQRCKILILAIGALILALEFQKLKEFLLVYFGQRQLKSDQKQDAKLATQENDDNQKADALVKEAQSLPSQETPVTDEWYKGNKK